MVDLTNLSAGRARLDLAPALGGGIARLDVDDLPVLRPWNGDAETPFALASNVLVPFSNRISGGGFDWEGRHYPLTPNLPGEPCPIHGDGFQKVWQAEHFDDTARLTLEDGCFGPWRYNAMQDFTLTDTGLDICLTITNTGPDPLPFGCGFHPWFPRDGATRLSFKADSVWMENAAHLPIEKLDLTAAPNWDFASARPLQDSWINNGYCGWTGTARIEQGDNAVSCNVVASENLNTALVFSPGAGSDFFCLEPASHPVDAFHLPGQPGLQMLRPGDQMQADMTLNWSVR